MIKPDTKQASYVLNASNPGQTGKRQTDIPAARPLADVEKSCLNGNADKSIVHSSSQVV